MFQGSFYHQHLLKFGKRQYNSRNRKDRRNIKSKKIKYTPSSAWYKNDKMKNRLKFRKLNTDSRILYCSKGWISRFGYILTNTPIY